MGTGLDEEKERERVIGLSDETKGMMIRCLDESTCGGGDTFCVSTVFNLE